MSYRTYTIIVDHKLIKPHGGYKGLRAYEMAEIVHDGTAAFTTLYLDRRSRTVDQMVQAARSGKQNIAEGSQASGTSKKIELKLVGIARASLEELLVDYTDFLRQSHLEQWPKDHEKAAFIRKLAYRPNRTYSTYRSYIEEKGPENAANALICVIHQTNFLLDRLLRQLDQAFLKEGGFTERMHALRSEKNRG
jgi:restriction system protein